MFNNLTQQLFRSHYKVPYSLSIINWYIWLDIIDYPVYNRSATTTTCPHGYILMNYNIPIGLVIYNIIIIYG